MLKSIFNGFMSNKSGKLYLISLLVLIMSNILISLNNNLYLLGISSLIFYAIALNYYCRYMEVKLWLTITLVALTLVPFGVWITFFYFVRKNYHIYYLEG